MGDSVTKLAEFTAKLFEELASTVELHAFYVLEENPTGTQFGNESKIVFEQKVSWIIF